MKKMNVFPAEQLCRGRLQEPLQAAAASRSQVKTLTKTLASFQGKGPCAGPILHSCFCPKRQTFDIASVSHLIIYRFVFLLRFHVCVRTLPFGQSVAKNPRYFLEMIWDMAEYANHLIRLSNKGNSCFFQFTFLFAAEF